MNKSNYGKELILDLHNCQRVDRFTRKDIKKFMVALCDLIHMRREDLHFWDYKGAEADYRKAPMHLRGTSAVQFISTSNIVIHTLDIMKRVYVNIFTCKTFNSDKAAKFCEKYFDGKIISKHIIDRI